MLMAVVYTNPVSYDDGSGVHKSRIRQSLTITDPLYISLAVLLLQTLTYIVFGRP